MKQYTETRIIDSCDLCPNFRWKNNNLFCIQKWQPIPHTQLIDGILTIPDFCPLPDNEKKKSNRYTIPEGQPAIILTLPIENKVAYNLSGTNEQLLDMVCSAMNDNITVRNLFIASAITWTRYNNPPKELLCDITENFLKENNGNNIQSDKT